MDAQYAKAFQEFLKRHEESKKRRYEFSDDEGDDKDLESFFSVPKRERGKRTSRKKHLKDIKKLMKEAKSIIQDCRTTTEKKAS